MSYTGNKRLVELFLKRSDYNYCLNIADIDIADAEEGLSKIRINFANPIDNGPSPFVNDTDKGQYEWHVKSGAVTWADSSAEREYRASHPAAVHAARFTIFLQRLGHAWAEAVKNEVGDLVALEWQGDIARLCEGIKGVVHPGIHVQAYIDVLEANQS